ncbi:MAG TPA: hypothetical protein PLO50_00905 [Nitrospira sp.]|nr:hypothetical protein [Nitrospira sp.]
MKNSLESKSIRATLHVVTEHMHGDNVLSVTYGLKDPLLIINGKSQPLSTEPHKFQVAADTFELAKDEFWGRMRVYLNRRFKQFIKITIEDKLIENI